VNTIGNAWRYAAEHRAEVITALWEHLHLVGISMTIALLLGVPLGILASRRRSASFLIVNGFNALRVVPSLAILFLAIPYFGLTTTTALLALTLLALPPILINTEVGLRQVSPSVKEAARGMGMSGGQRLWRVELPLALPVMVAGARTALVEVIASASLAAFIGAGGLGTFIVLGFALYDNSVLLVGAVPIALLALAAELLLTLLQRFVEPRQASRAGTGASPRETGASPRETGTPSRGADTRSRGTGAAPQAAHDS
jgi:osmoprotectant transport system permease protein